MLQRGLCKSIRSIQHDEHKPETRGRRSSTSNSIMRKVQRRRRGPELATLQSLNNCNVEPRATRTYGDLRTKVCERTFFSSGSSERGEDACWPKSEDQPTFCNVESYVHSPSLQRFSLSLEAILVSSIRQFCVSRLQKIVISFLEFFTRREKQQH